MSDNTELADLIRELEDIIVGVGKIRHRALVILMGCLASVVVWKVIAPPPGIMPLVQSFFWYMTVAAFGVFSLFFMGMTVWRFKLTRQHERLLKRLAATK